MDFTFIFLIILMLLAAQNGIMPLAVVMLILAFVTGKNKYALYGAAIAGALLAGIYLNFFKENGPELLIGGIFIIFLIAVKGEDQPPQGYGGGYSGMPGY